jgi:hypothetical protein
VLLAVAVGLVVEQLLKVIDADLALVGQPAEMVERPA